MSEMKSALERAMERAERLGAASDDDRRRWKYVPEGEKLAGLWLKDEGDLFGEVEKYDEPVLGNIPKICEDWVDNSTLYNIKEIPELFTSITIQVEEPNPNQEPDDIEESHSVLTSKILSLDDYPEISSTWQAFIGSGWSSWSGSFEGFSIAGVADQVVGTAATLVLVAGGSDQYSGSAILTAISNVADVTGAEAVKKSFTFQGTGTLTQGT